MFFENNDFMEFAGYRNMVVEDKIEKCLAEARNGAASITIDRGDLTDDELRYLQREVNRRLCD